MAGRKARPAIDRFWDYVDKRGPDDCWLWQGGRRGQYGSFSMPGAKGAAHKASYLIHKGSIPDGLDILHSCDTPLCVNPKHLRAGTHRENIVDMYQKGRGYIGNGEKCNLAKLNADDVRDIKRKIALGMTDKEIAAEYDFTYQGIREIRLGRNWKHITIDEN